MNSNNLEFFCNDCGCTEVEIMVWSVWDADKEEFVVDHVPDHSETWCPYCERNGVSTEFGDQDDIAERVADREECGEEDDE